MNKILTIIMVLICGTAFADNAFVSYISKWVDETRVEIAIGKLLSTRFMDDVSKEYKITEEKSYTQSFASYAEKCGIKNGTMDFKVMVINSEIPDEILLPGGTLFVTKGYLQYASSKEQIDFILARNAYLTFKKQPLVVIKHEGMYPRFIDAIRASEANRSEESVRSLLTLYLSVVSKMNHKQADLQGALLTANPEKTRRSAVEMLSRFTVKVWPQPPFDTIGLPARIADLENIKLPENKL